ncbi:Nucleotide-binding, alpha-beta plait [Penicillium expansum]|nr:Nucleotide-binding, alpha-beta plait [Penicillium expansum]KGO61352.1 Nucleotide-binding, alpha-beta plait [Penicillium expansum]
MIAMGACMMIDRDLARLRPTAESSTPETENLDKATVAMIAMIIAVELQIHHPIGAGTRTKTETERVIEARAAIEVELAALVEASPIWDRSAGSGVWISALSTTNADNVLINTQIAAELSNAYHINGLEDIRVIRDRQTKLSRQLGFLRFSTIDASREFVERNHPSIFFYAVREKTELVQKVQATGTAGSVSFSTFPHVHIVSSAVTHDPVRTPSPPLPSPISALTHLCPHPSLLPALTIQADMDPTGPPGVPAPKIANDGDNDVAPETQPSQFLLIRGLEASVTEELLAKGVAKLYRPSGTNDSAPDNQKKGSKVASTTGDSNLGAREGSLRRVLLVRDRRTNASWRYGFAEFAGIKDAQAAMTRLKSFEKFTISSKPVLVTYIHGGVFVPVMNAQSGASYYTFSPSNNPLLKLMYWDDAAYVTELVLSTAEDDAAQEQKANKTASNHGDGQAKGTKDSDKGKKRKADVTTSSNTKKLAMPSQLQFWSDRHAELHGINRDDAGNPAEGSKSAAPDTEPAALTTESAAPATTGLPVSEHEANLPRPSFADWEKLCCYLCMQDFVDIGHLRWHTYASPIHREKLKDVKLRELGVCWLIIYGVIPMPTPNYEGSKDEYRDALEREYSIPPTARSFADLERNWCLLCFNDLGTPGDLYVHDRFSERHRKELNDEEAMKWGLDQLKQAGIAQDIVQAPAEYRDRAKERRQAFGREDANARQKAPEPEEEEETPVQTNTIGASLLTKMGWREGSGLGAQGTGVTEPIPTEIYAQGVGLGAQGSRLGEATEEAGRNTRGRYDEFLEKTKDAARQRYDELDRP